MTAVKLRGWRGVKLVAGPAGAAITTRLWTTPGDEQVLGLVAEHLGRLRRADLARVCQPVAVDPGLDGDAKRAVRRDRLNTRKRALTAASSARWANAIIDQYRLSRDAQHRHIIGLRAAIATLEKRLAQPSADTLTAEQRRQRRKTKLPKGYATQAERFAKQRRLQILRAKLVGVSTDFENRRVHVVDGGKRLASTGHHLDSAGLTETQWRQRWQCARDRITAKGCGDEPFGNLTITVTPDGQVSLRLPKPLEHLANSARGRYVLSGAAVFSHRADQWLSGITDGKAVAYALTAKPGRAGRYLSAYWANPPERISGSGEPATDIRARGPIVGVDLNEGHLALRRLDAHGNPLGRAERIDIDLAGGSARRDAQIRPAVTRLIHYTRGHHISAIAVEDLDFADARASGRETLGRGSRGKRFRKSVAGIPTAVFRHRLAAAAHRNGIGLYAVNPAYSSVWGQQHWRAPY